MIEDHDNLRKIQILELKLHYNIVVDSISAKDNHIPDTMSRKGDPTTDTPDEKRTLFSTIQISRLKKTLKKIRKTRIISFYPKLMAEDAKLDLKL